jgi:NAD dependent epimerase/dehydratase family enzyme
MPWIHINDLCNIFIMAIEKKGIHGIYNAVAPQHITNTELTYCIAKRLNKKIWLPNIPSFILKTIYGKMANLFLEGSRVSSEKIEKTGFQFEYPTLETTLKSLN